MCLCDCMPHVFRCLWRERHPLKRDLEVVVNSLTWYWESKSNPWRVDPALDHWAIFLALSSHSSSTKKHLMATAALAALPHSHSVVTESSFWKLCFPQIVHSLGQTACEICLFSVTCILGIPCTWWFKYKSCTDSIIVKYIVFW